MHRRSFLTFLGTSPAAWPLAARAQQRAVQVIGYLSVGWPDQSATTTNAAAFLKGLSENGFVEGRNVAIEYRFAKGQYDRLHELAADLVQRRVSVIIASNAGAEALAAKAKTRTIPIIFAMGGDPVGLGLVASLNRPGGNATGITGMATELTAKRLGILHELMPSATRFAVLVNPNGLGLPGITADANAAIAAIGGHLDILPASTSREVEASFASILQNRIDAVVVGPGPPINERRVQIVTLAARYGVPAIYSARLFPEVGGLMSYNTNFTDGHRQIGIYTARILKGEKAGDLPVMRATKFEFVINLSTAKAFGITFPPTLLAIADEVIE